jgi:DNA-binding transcriptional MerR regulator/methylmalonyl-CoA mutase cobalamin-binding subunit
MAIDTAQPRYPVRVAAQRSGLTPHVLRAWERRYSVVTPTRSEGGQRLYSDTDVERLRLLRRLTRQGHGIGHLAKLPLDELDRISRDGEAIPAESRAGDSSGTDQATEFRSAALRAAQCLAASELQAVLERAAGSLGVPTFLEQVAAPSIREIGHGWREGSITVGQEHLATAVFRRVLGWIIDTFQVDEPTARLLVATPPHQVHELGALLAAAAAATEGWDVIYLGADLPVAEILTAARQVGATGVALSVVLPTNDPALFDDLTEIREGLDPEVHLFLGGAAVAEQPERFRAVGGRVIESLAEFRSELRRLQERS